MEILTGNELMSGATVYLDRQGHWVEELEQARVFLPEEAEARDAAIAATKKTLRINSLEIETVTLRDLLEAVSEGAVRAGVQVSVVADPELTAQVRPNALRRALANLIMNAAGHGERVEVAARARAQGGVEISVDDDGPGIPEARYEEAFKAFGRLDEARNQNAKGVGLGLAIARDVARGHGGDIILSRSPLGGLRAVLRLPG